MPTLNPRLTITLPREIHAILGRLAAVQERSISSIVREFLEEAEPVLSTMTETLERLKAAQARASGELRDHVDALQEAHDDLLPSLHALVDQLGTIADIAEGGPCVTPVSNRGVRYEHQGNTQGADHEHGV